MPHPVNNVTRAQFDKVYDLAITGRKFVENREYYFDSRKRFWKCFKYIESLSLPPGTRTLDVGGGIMAVLLSKLLKHDAIVGDVNDVAKTDIEDLGLEFALIDLFRDNQPEVKMVDLIILQEVIEHIPQPPYLVLNRLAKYIKPGGFLFLTTPNGHRFRNLIYMALGREILGLYRYPEPGQALGHQHEYTLKQMIRQVDLTNLNIITTFYYDDGFAGASKAARLAWMLCKPASIVPYWRNGIVMILKNK